MEVVKEASHTIVRVFLVKRLVLQQKPHHFWAKQVGTEITAQKGKNLLQELSRVFAWQVAQKSAWL